MIENTYVDFINMSEYHGDIGNFIQLYPVLNGYSKEYLYKERTIITQKLNSVDYLIEHLENNPLFRSKIINGNDDTLV